MQYINSITEAIGPLLIKVNKIGKEFGANLFVNWST